MLDSKYRGRRKGVEIRPGSVREARRESKLSLAEVAGEEVSRAAIHLIESGRSRPSMQTLERIATRTGKPIEFFLQGEHRPAQFENRDELVELDRLIATRDFHRVIELGESLLDKNLDESAATQVRFYIGQALCRLVRPQEAMAYLPAARQAFDTSGDTWMAVEALDWESSAMGLLEDPSALDTALEALRRCRSLTPRPALLEARILGHIANMHVVGHAWAEAVRYYNEALDAARGVKDLLQLAKTHHGLATAYQRLEQPTTAKKHFDRALALYSLESDLSAVYRVENDLGELLLRQGHLKGAATHLRNALAGSDDLAIDRRGRGYILANLGEVSMREGDFEEASKFLEQALAAGVAVGESVVVANAHQLLGQLSERQARPGDADRHFEDAIRGLERLGMPNRLRDCHMDFAELLNARGDIAGAAGHWRIAAEVSRNTSRGIASHAASIEESEQASS